MCIRDSRKGGSGRTEGRGCAPGSERKPDGARGRAGGFERADAQALRNFDLEVAGLLICRAICFAGAGNFKIPLDKLGFATYNSVGTLKMGMFSRGRPNRGNDRFGEPKQNTQGREWKWLS